MASTPFQAPASPPPPRTASSSPSSGSSRPLPALKPDPGPGASDSLDVNTLKAFDAADACAEDQDDDGRPQGGPGLQAAPYRDVLNPPGWNCCRPGRCLGHDVAGVALAVAAGAR